MRWQQGTLYLKPPGKFQFSPLYEFPDIVGNAEVDFACDLLTVNETLERFTKRQPGCGTEEGDLHVGELKL